MSKLPLQYLFNWRRNRVIVALITTAALLFSLAAPMGTPAAQAAVTAAGVEVSGSTDNTAGRQTDYTFYLVSDSSYAADDKLAIVLPAGQVISDANAVNAQIKISGGEFQAATPQVNAAEKTLVLPFGQPITAGTTIWVRVYGSGITNPSAAGDNTVALAVYDSLAVPRVGETAAITVQTGTMTPNPARLLQGYTGPVNVTVTVSSNISLDGATLFVQDSSNATKELNGTPNFDNISHTAAFSVPAGWSAGAYSIILQTSTVRLKVPFYVASATLSPSTVNSGYTNQTLTVSGNYTNFLGTDQVTLLDGSSQAIAGGLTDLNRISATQLQFKLADGRAAGSYTVRVTTEGGTFNFPLTVQPPRSVAIAPDYALEGYTNAITVVATGSNTSFTSSGGSSTTVGLFAGSTNRSSYLSGLSVAGAASLSFSLATGLPQGQYEVRITTGGEVVTDTFTVKGITLDKSSATAGYSAFNINITGLGTGFTSASQIAILDSSGSDTSKVTAKPYTSSTNYAITVGAGLTAGEYKVRVTTGDEVLTAPLTINPAPGITLSKNSSTANNLQAVDVVVYGANTNFAQGNTTVEMRKASDDSLVSGGIATGSIAVSSPTQLSFQIAAGRSAGSYKIRVATGDEVTYTDFTVTSAAAPADVTGFTVTPGNGKLLLSWVKPNDPTLDHFNLYYRISGGSYGAATVIAKTYESYELTSLANGTTYEIKLTSAAADSTESGGPVASGTPDGTPPTVSISGPANAAQLNSGQFAYTATAADTGSSIAWVKFEYKAAGDSTWSVAYADYSAPYAAVWSLPLSDGSYNLRVTAADGAGNTASTSGTRTITVDTTAPTGGSVQINANAAYTNSRNVTLTLAATGAAQMQVSESINFDDAIWETYNTSKAFTLSSGDGTKTVYAKFKDTAGNESAAVSDEITLDSSAPVISGLTPAEGSLTNDSTPQISATVSDTGSEIDEGLITLLLDGTQVGHSYTVGNVTYGLGQDLAEGAHTVTLVVYDNAGNYTGAASSFDVDTTAPAAPVVTAPSNAATVSGTTYNYNITGTAEAEATVKVYSDPNNNGTKGSLAASGTAAGGSFSIAVSLTAGNTHNFLVTATDLAGNESTVADVYAITRPAILGGSPGGVTPQVDPTEQAISGAQEQINNSSATDGEIADAAAKVAKTLFEQPVANAAQANQVVTNAGKVAELLNTAATRVQSEEAAAQVAGNIAKIAETLAKAAEKVATADAKAGLAENTAKVLEAFTKATVLVQAADKAAEVVSTQADTIKAAAAVAGKIENAKDAAKVVNSVSAMVNQSAALVNKVDAAKAVDAAKDIISNVAAVKTAIEGKAEIKGQLNQETKALAEAAAKTAQAALTKTATESLSASDLKTEGDKTIAEVAAAKITQKVDALLAAAQSIEAELTKNDLAAGRELNKKVTVEIPAAQGTKQVEASLPGSTLAEVAAKGIDLEIKTEVASIAVPPQAFGDLSNGKNISLAAAKVETQQLPEALKQKVPAGSAIVDLNAAIGGEKISKFNKPLEVGVPYTLKAGENPKAVTVFLLKDDGTLEAVGGKYDAATGRVLFATQHFSKYFAKEAVREFKDVSSIGWAKDQIAVLAGKGIISGKSADSFDPNANITRAEFATLVVKMLKLETEQVALPFSDVKKDNWYYSYVAGAYANGIIKGKSAASFDPNGNITRQEMATIIANVLLSRGYKAAEADELDKFNDGSAISGWAKAAVALAARESIISGMGDGSFAPGAKATRAQAAVMLYNLFEK